MDCYQTGQADSATEKQRPRSLVLAVKGLAPHLELTSLLMMEFLVLILAFVLRCALCNSASDPG